MTPEVALPLLTTTTGGRLSSQQIRCPTRRVFNGTGLELVTSQLRSDTLTTRLPRPLHLKGVKKKKMIDCLFTSHLDEVGKPIDENSACVEVGTTHKHLRRGDKSNNFKNYFSSNDITCEEVKSVESTFLLDTSYVRATREPEKKKKGRIFLNFYKMYKNALKEDLKRVVEKLDGTVESTDTMVKLKTKIENSSTFESDPDFVKNFNSKLYR
ncbi:hypothetical protein TNCV_4964571 [Trichonephila clavipes]|nr:hypothetical protein TNCV_4964571 [Trichonephila clavipes]